MRFSTWSVLPCRTAEMKFLVLFLCQPACPCACSYFFGTFYNCLQPWQGVVRRVYNAASVLPRCRQWFAAKRAAYSRSQGHGGPACAQSTNMNKPSSRPTHVCLNALECGSAHAAALYCLQSRQSCSATDSFGPSSVKGHGRF